ncbi:ribonuclease H-like domain-containing protein [Tanacetum coccineum]
MNDEYNALIKNNTWALVPRPTDANIVRCMWLFRHKYLAYGTLSRYMARIVANGSMQLEGIDVDETFSPILDVENVFSRDDLSETVYMHQPRVLGFWIGTAYLLLYVDDIVPTASFETLLQQINASLHQKFSMTDLGSLNYFLGNRVTLDSSGMLLSQRKYTIEILERAHMVNCNPSRTPVDTEYKLGDDGDPVFDLTLYQSLVGSLQYLTFTRPDISCAVQQVCLYMYDPREPHFSALKRILRLSWLSNYSAIDFSAKAKYYGVANVVAETCWLRNLLCELHTPLSSATLVYCDNVSAVYLSSNPVQHQRTKYIEIYIHFVRNLVVAGQVRVLHVSSGYNYSILQFEDKWFIFLF